MAYVAHITGIMDKAELDEFDALIERGVDPAKAERQVKQKQAKAKAKPKPSAPLSGQSDGPEALLASADLGPDGEALKPEQAEGWAERAQEQAERERAQRQAILREASIAASLNRQPTPPAPTQPRAIPPLEARPGKPVSHNRLGAVRREARELIADAIDQAKAGELSEAEQAEVLDLIDYTMARAMRR